MEAIDLNHPGRLHRYACTSLTVTPNPPKVGEVTTLGLAFKNPGPDPIIVKRIALRVSHFGMGIGWEELPPVGPFHLAADPTHVEQVKIEWTPTKGGHRCVHGQIHVEGQASPLWVGRNLDIIGAGADERNWRIPFYLGNPEEERLPIILQMGANEPEAVGARVIVAGRLVRAGQPIWLNGKEEVEAELLLRARTNDALEYVQTVEAFVAGKFIDGIQVEVHRPAYSLWQPRLLSPTEEASYEAPLALAR